MDSQSGMANLNSVHGYTGSTCGYCHGKKSHWTCGFACDKITTQDYLEMMDRGWRRCGDYWYRPDNERCCCKMYTIRLNVENYQMRKSHKKVMKKWNKFLAGEPIKADDAETEESKKPEDKDKITVEQHKKEIVKTDHHVNLEGTIQALIKKMSEETQISKMNEIFGFSNDNPFTIGEKVNKECKVLKTNSKKFGDFSNNLIMLLFAENKAKLANKNLNEFVEKIKSYILENLQPLAQPIQVTVQQSGHIMFTLPAEEKSQNGNQENGVVKLIEEKNGKKENKEKNAKENNHNGLDIEEHKDGEAKTNLTPRKFEIKFERAKFDKESFDMYQRYCKDIHEKDKEDPKGYEKFLCMQSLTFGKQESNGKTLELGCYHMKYYIDGKFVAVGVVDITAVCLSSVYFFYDPAYKNLSLGVVGAVKEIEWVQEMHKYFPQFKYYYLGYYIHDCQKMVYKGDYEPAELLCPQTMTWVILTDELRKKLDNKPTRLSDKNAKLIEDMDYSQNNIEKYVKDKIKIFIGRYIKIIQLNKQYQDYFVNAFKDIAQALGKKLSGSFVFGVSE